MTLGKIIPRKDGKYLVEQHFSGGPNGFGGEHHGRTFRKIVTPEKLAELKAIAALGHGAGKEAP